MTDRLADEAAIHALFEVQREGWSSGDADLFASAFSADAEFYNITSQLLKGRAEIARHHDQLWKNVYAGVQPELSEQTVRFIHDDAATSTSRAVLKLPIGERHAHLLAVAVRTADGWKLAALHNMIPFVPPAP